MLIFVDKHLTDFKRCPFMNALAYVMTACVQLFDYIFATVVIIAIGEIFIAIENIYYVWPMEILNFQLLGGSLCRDPINFKIRLCIFSEIQ